MTLGNKIAQCRKSLAITQDALAHRLGVTNQAVSKWESDQCCPDVTLLPKLADIFGITIDELFGREPQPKKEAEAAEQKRNIHIYLGNAGEVSWNAPAPVWPDDETLRVVAYIGHQLVQSAEACEKLTFQYEGPALNIHSHISVACGDVEGDVDAGRDISCSNVEGNVDAGRDVSCGDVGGDVDAGKTVSCGNVAGDVDAGSFVGCGQVSGDVDAGTDVKCGDVGGDVDAGGNVECTNVEGDIDAGGSVTIRK